MEKIVPMNTSGTAIKNEVIRGGVAVEKWDSEKDKREPQGTATLDGTKIQIISQNTNTVLVDGKEYKKGEVITTLTTDKDGKASTAADYLPYGNYQLKEQVPLLVICLKEPLPEISRSGRREDRPDECRRYGYQK